MKTYSYLAPKQFP